MITGCCPVEVCKMALNSTLKKFDPEEHKGSVYEAFNEFVDKFQYEYNAIAKDPPKELEFNDAPEEWIQQNKRKIFLGRFASRNLKKEYEEVVPELQRAKISFNDIHWPILNSIKFISMRKEALMLFTVDGQT